MQKKGGDAPTTDLEAASLDELNQKVVTLEREKNKEEDYRNYMQLERVRIDRTAFLKAHARLGRDTHTQPQLQQAWCSPTCADRCALQYVAVVRSRSRRGDQ